MKVCNRCKRLLDESEFYSDKRTADGLSRSCKRCKREKEKAVEKTDKVDYRFCQQCGRLFKLEKKDTKRNPQNNNRNHYICYICSVDRDNKTENKQDKKKEYINDKLDLLEEFKIYLNKDKITDMLKLRTEVAIDNRIHMIIKNNLNKE